jgi:tellurite resistance protein TerC
MTVRDAPPPPLPRAAIRQTLFWTALALAFGGVLWGWRGPEAAQQYLAGYLIELSLSVDNVFVFLLIFARFHVAPHHQPRVLFWGIAGAMLMRGAFILAGVSVIRRLPFVLFLFGAFLIHTGVRLLRAPGRKDAIADPAENIVARAARRFLPMTARMDGSRFFTIENGRRLATPLLLVLLLVETADFMFAFDSLPAVLAVTKSSLVALSSNLFAVLGLRSLYSVLEGAIPRFRLLKLGVALILVFIGAKMLAAPWVAISTTLTLAVIGSVLTACFLAGGSRATRSPG